MTARIPKDPLSFLQSYVEAFPEGTYAGVFAIKPDGGAPAAAYAPVDDVNQLDKFIKKHRKSNLYFSINPVKRKLTKKATKRNISYVCYAQVDCDPDPNRNLITERKRILAELKKFTPKPTVIIDSGGGYQALWRLADPVRTNRNAAELERISKALERELEADHCSNIDRIFRLPGTTNHPNAKKREAGRTEAPAKLVSYNSLVYGPGDFADLGGDESDDADEVTITRQITLRDVDVDSLNVTPTIKQLIRTGQSPDRSYKSRSDAMMAVVAALRHAGHDDATIFSVCLDHQNAISAHAWAQGDSKKAIRAVERMVTKLAADTPVARGALEQIDQLTAKLVEPATKFVGRRLPARRYILDGLLPEQSLALFAGAKSIGKTFVILTMLGAIASGSRKTFLGFKIPKKRRCLFVDGEMPAKELQDRLRYLFGNKVPPLLEVVSSEVVREAIGGSLKINNPLHQQAFLRTLDELDRQGRRPEVIAFDNLSSLTFGVDENSNSGEMDFLLEFFLNLRHIGYAVIFVHHLNKEGTQRGGNRKEDPVDLSVVLSPLGRQRDRAAFQFVIKDIRGRRPKPDRFTCELRPDKRTGLPTWHVEDMPKPRGWVATLVAISRFRPRTQTELVEALGISKSVASKHVKKLREKGLVIEKGLTVTDDGQRYLTAVEDRHGELHFGVFSESDT